ncbi:hypothetical protein GJV85_08585 [Sulfurimonas aquatica]|uniref:Uncharacterized protein n=1 Tax=Sulfurimonas aquatica TaxID=2672570 RepID=A0A975B0V2_9BACT|nr:hypothetical protein [Sulfurimonas aquatica]QSZ42166.1 hypothetical protein GJV85_08585 [Sulfurimonas aquatica]
MKKIFFILLFMLCTVSSATTPTKYDAMIESQCHYIVNGTGVDNDFTHVYMAGLVTKRVYTTDFKYLTKIAKTSTRQNTIKIACEEALLNTSNLKFDVKFKNGLSITLDTRYAKHSKRK